MSDEIQLSVNGKTGFRAEWNNRGGCRDARGRNKFSHLGCGPGRARYIAGWASVWNVVDDQRPATMSQD